MANDVELPPTVSNLGFLMEEDELYKDSPLKVGEYYLIGDYITTEELFSKYK